MTTGPDLHAIVIGTDAVLAVQPAEPLQLFGACLAAGFDLAVPVSWGEELVATEVARQAGGLGTSSAVQSSCPFVDEQLRMMAEPLPVIETVSAPVACARYLRRAFPARTVRVTYAGSCPGATTPDVDERVLPDVLVARLVEAGVDLLAQPRQFGTHVPPDRARYASQPGGAPDGAWLMAATGARLVEAAPVTAPIVAREPSANGAVVDLAVASRCACARQRLLARRLEPPRSAAPVVLDHDAQEPERAYIPVDREVPAAVSREAGLPRGRQRRVRDHDATFAENGLSQTEAEAPLPLTHVFSEVREPWTTQ